MPTFEIYQFSVLFIELPNINNYTLTILFVKRRNFGAVGGNRIHVVYIPIYEIGAVATVPQRQNWSQMKVLPLLFRITDSV